MKILLTGVTGFLGSHLVRVLNDNGHNVIGLKRRMSDTSRLADLLEEICFFDVEDGLEKLFEAHSDIALVVHAATSYGNQGESLSEVFMANVILPLKIIELSSCNRDCVFINTDTYFAKADGEYSYLADYVLSKTMLYQLGKRLSEKNERTFVNIRLEHVFGPHDGSNKFTTSIIRQLLENKPLIKLTDGDQLRDFIFIDDVVAAYISIINSPEVMGSRQVRCFEVGSGEAHTIKDFVLTAQQITGAESVLSFGALPYRENEIMHSEANLKPLLELGWSCEVSMEAGIENVVSSLAETPVCMEK